MKKLLACLPPLLPLDLKNRVGKVKFVKGCDFLLLEGNRDPFVPMNHDPPLFGLLAVSP